MMEAVLDKWDWLRERASVVSARELSLSIRANEPSARKVYLSTQSSTSTALLEKPSPTLKQPDL